MSHCNLRLTSQHTCDVAFQFSKVSIERSIIMPVIPLHIWCLYCFGRQYWVLEQNLFRVFCSKHISYSQIFFSFIKPQHMMALESSGKTTLNLHSQNYVKLDGKYINFTFVKKQSSTIHPVSNISFTSSLFQGSFLSGEEVSQ